MTSLATLTKIAACLFEDKPVAVSPERGMLPFVMEYQGKVKPKERVRGVGNHFYTPAETREFEETIKKRGKEIMKRSGLHITRSPIEAKFTVYEEMPKKLKPWQLRLVEAELFLPLTRKDLDNMEKAVLDALNKVYYVDDRQIIKVTKSKLYGRTEGFSLAMWPIGLSGEDLDNIEVLLNGWKRG